MRMCAPGAELPIACAQRWAWAFHLQVLERLGERLQAAVQVSAHWGRGTGYGPGPCDQGLTGLGMAGRRETSLPSALAAGRCRSVRPRSCLSGRGRSPRVLYPRAARSVTAPVHGTPRRACRARPRRDKLPAFTCAWRSCARRWRRAVGAVTAPTSSCRPGGGPPVARPVYRIACRRRKALRRNVAVCSAWHVSARARLRSRMAASSTAATSHRGYIP